MKAPIAWKASLVSTAIVILAGCGAQTNTAAPQALAPMHRAQAQPAGLLDGESFSSDAATSRCRTDKNGDIHGTFTASGDASGPYPGSFTQSGSIAGGDVFRSQFTLKSGSATFAGHFPRYAGGARASCSNGELGLSFSHSIKYHIHHVHTGGLATPALDGATFTESFYEQ